MARAELDRVLAQRSEATRGIDVATGGAEQRRVAMVRATLLAPFDGLVTRRLREPGDTVTIGSTVLRIVDTNRVYVCGMSLAGYGTLHFIGKHAHKLTAGVALCGGGNSKDACNLSTVPLWIQHGTADKPVPVSESRNIVKAIKACNGGKNLIYKEIPGANHGAMERVFRSDEMYDWLFSKMKEVVAIEVENTTEVEETETSTPQ